MKRNNDHYYPEISSFEDIRLEKTRLILKGKLIESKIGMDILQVREAFSISALVISIARKFIPQELSAILESILNR
jgi:hypothetical protein